ncbi:hypothetical protein CPB86DRAFT_784508, partial [Serendipita vermifera]
MGNQFVGYRVVGSAACGCSYLLLLRAEVENRFDHLLVLVLLGVDDRNHDDNEQYDDTKD